MKQTEYFCFVPKMTSNLQILFNFFYVVLKFRKKKNYEGHVNVFLCIISSWASWKTNKHNTNNNIYTSYEVPLTLLTKKTITIFWKYDCHHIIAITDSFSNRLDVLDKQCIIIIRVCLMYAFNYHWYYLFTYNIEFCSKIYHINMYTYYTIIYTIFLQCTLILCKRRL